MTNKKIEWINTQGRAVLIIDGSRTKIKPGQKFYATPDEVPEGFRDTMKPTDPENAPVTTGGQADAIDVKKLTYTAQHKGGGWYHVVDSNGKQVTDKPLQKNKVDEFIEALT